MENVLKLRTGKLIKMQLHKSVPECSGQNLHKIKDKFSALIFISPFWSTDVRTSPPPSNLKISPHMALLLHISLQEAKKENLLNTQVVVFKIYWRNLSAPIEPRRILGGKEHESGVGFDHFLCLSDEELPVVIQQSIQSLEDISGGKVQFI